MENSKIIQENLPLLLLRCFIVIVAIVVIILIAQFILKGASRLVPAGTLKSSKLKTGGNPNGFIFGRKRKAKVYLPCTSEGHIFVFGGSGSGKTSALLIPSLRTWLGTFFVIDISGDIEANVDCEDKVVINPDDPENSVVYNILDYIDSVEDPQDRKERMENLVNLIVDKPSGQISDASKYFIETARIILLASLIAFYDEGKDFTEICNIVFFNNTNQLIKKIEDTGNDKAAAYVASLKGGNEKNIAGAKEELDKKIRVFADNERVKKMLRRADPIKTENGEAILEPHFVPADIENNRVFLNIPDTKTEYYSALMRVIVGQILDYLASRHFDKNEDKRILLALDEFASLGHVDIREPLEKDRKRGVNICILTQSLAHLDLLYSVPERKIILDNCQYTAILGANENDTRRYFSELVGKHEIVRGKGGNTRKDYVIDPENWNKLGKRIILVHPGGYCRLRKNFYFEN